MKTVCRSMGLARSHVKQLLGRREAWVDGRKHRKPSDDASLLAELKLQIAELPSYGYRRACALVNRLRSAQGAARVNAKRAYRVMMLPLLCGVLSSLLTRPFCAVPRTSVSRIA